jgi:hypothetical protein
MPRPPPSPSAPPASLLAHPHGGGVGAWLAVHKLDRYRFALCEAGYDELDFLATMGSKEEQELIAQLNMPRPHARAFQQALEGIRSGDGALQATGPPPSHHVHIQAAQPVVIMAEPTTTVQVAVPQPVAQQRQQPPPLQQGSVQNLRRRQQNQRRQHGNNTMPWSSGTGCCNRCPDCTRSRSHNEQNSIGVCLCLLWLLSAVALFIAYFFADLSPIYGHLCGAWNDYAHHCIPGQPDQDACNDPDDCATENACCGPWPNYTCSEYYANEVCSSCDPGNAGAYCCVPPSVPIVSGTCDALTIIGWILGCLFLPCLYTGCCMKGWCP